MIATPIPSHEAARLAALHRYHILDTSSEPAFDELARLAAYVCRAPIAVISLVDSSRQWFKSVIGLAATESPRAIAFCAHTIMGTDLFIVEDAAADERFADHPWVVDVPSIRFYAGVPLITPDGQAIGSLAVMDLVSRTLTPEQRTGMHTLAKQVMAQFKLRQDRRSSERAPFELPVSPARLQNGSDFDRAEDERSKQEMLLTLMLNTGPGCIKRVAADGTLLHMNPAGLKLIEACGEQEAVGRSVFDLVLPEHREAFMRMHQDVIGGAARTLQFKVEGLLGTRRWLETHAVPFRNPVTGGTEHLAMTYDITTHKQAEGALRLSEERLHQALQASNTGLWDWNTETGEVRFSKEWKSQLGYGESELSDSFETWVSRLHPEDRERAILYAQQYRDNPVGAFRQDFRLRHKDGSYRWIDSHASFVTEPDGRQIHLLGSHTDITERKQAEEALYAQGERLHALVEGTSDAVFIKDLQGKYLLFNAAGAHFVGKPSTEVIGQDDTFLFSPGEARAVMEGDRRVMASGTILTYEDHVTTSDGARRTFSSTKGPLFDQQGAVSGMFGISRDITEQKRIEEALRQSEERYRRYFELGLIGMAVTSLEKGWVQVNDRLCEIFGYSQVELTSKTWTELTHPDDIAPDVAQFNRVLAGEINGYSMDKRFLHKDGHVIYASISACAVRRADGAIDHFVALVQDITTRKQTEQLLSGEKRILEMIGADAPLPAVLDEVCRMIEGLSNGALCSILLLDDDGMHLRHGAAPNLPDTYVRAIDGMTIGPLRGSCGTAAFTGRQIIVEDIARNPLWADFRSLALSHGLRACWSMPIISAAGKVLGTFAVYYQTVRSLGSEVSIVDRASYLACLAIERARAQSALRLTRFSIDRAVDAVFWIDSQARILDINDAACTLLGYTREELLSRTVHDIDPSFPAEAWPAHWAELKARKSFSFETDHLRKDGSIIQTETTVNFLIHEGQEYNCAFMRDITDRKRAKEVLRMTRFSVERVSDAVFWINSNARILDVNEAACLSLRYSREELLALSLFEIDPQVTPDNWARLWRDKLERQSLTFESTQIRKDGTAFPIEITCNHLRFGEQEFCCAIARDISERKDAEGRVKFSEERFRLVAEATNDILWDWDLVTREHWWSPNAREKFGYDDHAEPSISAWTDRLHPDDRERVMAIVDQALASETKTVTAEYRFRLADGSYGYFYDRGQIVRDASGQAIRMIGAMIDVTLSKRAYASLEAAYQRLRSMSRELQAVETNERRRLSRELHDEVGQLLTALKFDLEASRQALSDKVVVEAGRAFERTVRALETTDELFVRLRRVVRALRPSVLEELGLKDALEAMVSEIQSRSDLACSVSVEGTAAEDAATPAIEAALYRMAQELVTNVVRHAQAMTLSVVLDADASQWRLTVQDDGVGFNPKAESISGMGIRGVRERAEILGGHVDVSSLPGAGTTITVWIPVQARAEVDDGV